jgi:thiaminase
MKNMVITYGEDGSVEHLLKDAFFKPGEEGQDRQIERISEILPTSNGQEFFIKFLMGPWKGQNFGEIFEATLFSGCDAVRYYEELVEQNAQFSYRCWGTTYFFPDYDTAVKWEIAIVNELRRRGVTFA